MIVLPDRFKKKLDKISDSLQVEVSSAKRNFSQIYLENNTYFFDEYTDHGFRHVNSILTAIDDLIPGDTWKLLSSKDIFVLLASVFLHDLGMHIQPLTFYAMMNGEYDDIKSYGFKDSKWQDLWNEYIDEAKRWNEEELNNLFGDINYKIEIPFFDVNESLNDNKKKLIGEFIRRHHPRIAFELSIKGLKTRSGNFIDLCPNLTENLRFIIGTVARSHGMNIRETFDIVKGNFADIWKRPDGVHIVYLMVLLRLADYLQIDENRILKIPYQTKLFKSPISVFEHLKHLCVTGVQPLTDDQETLFVNVVPDNGTIFVSLKKLLIAIQSEFDISWAIIGEMYGGSKHRDKPQIKYRRIKSNLDNITYSSNLPYVPELVNFSADKELLKLLIAPLYGHDPSYGIRELLQNSIDACRERDIIERKNQIYYNGDVAIHFQMNEDGRTIFSISDNGKGMTLNEIKNYFLRAGSSLKKSREWRRNFINENKTPEIHRIGKFGIGVLAAYLLGDEIIVKTRSRHSNIGYTFQTKIDNSNIEITKVDEMQIGTNITIFVADSVRNQLLSAITDRLNQGADFLEVNNRDKYYKYKLNDKQGVVYRWDKWFTLGNPKVKIRIYNFPEFAPYVSPDPSPEEQLPIDWAEFHTNEFDKIRWTYSNNYTRTHLSCNGIVIPHNFEFYETKLGSFRLKAPFISVFYLNGNLNLDLSRNAIVENKLQFEEELLNSIFSCILAKVFSLDIKYENELLILSKDSIFEFEFPGLTDTFSIAYIDKGYVINMPFFDESIVEKKVITMRFDPIELGNKELRIKQTDTFFLLLPKSKKAESEDIIATPFASFSDDEAIYVKNNISDINDYIPPALIVFHEIKRSIVQNSYHAVKFIEFCKKYMKGGMIIPYDIEERRRIFKDIFIELNITI